MLPSLGDWGLNSPAASMRCINDGGSSMLQCSSNLCWTLLYFFGQLQLEEKELVLHERCMGR